MFLLLHGPYSICPCIPSSTQPFLPASQGPFRMILRNPSCNTKIDRQRRRLRRRRWQAPEKFGAFSLSLFTVCKEGVTLSLSLLRGATSRPVCAGRHKILLSMQFWQSSFVRTNPHQAARMRHVTEPDAIICARKSWCTCAGATPIFLCFMFADSTRLFLCQSCCLACMVISLAVSKLLDCQLSNYSLAHTSTISVASSC